MGVVVLDKPQKVEIQKIDNMVVLIWPGDPMLNDRDPNDMLLKKI